MRIKEKLYLDYTGLVNEGPITIVAFGDSVTHGALGAGEINYETAYWNLLRKKLHAVRDYMPINVINAGIGGIRASSSLGRVERDVLSHHPDLVIVCFGLNDVNGTLEDYLNSLIAIFAQCKEAGIETIFMTPNMLNTSVSPLTEAKYMDYAHVTAEYQNGGRMDLYIESAVKIAEDMGIKVANCYAKWKELSKTQDITSLLANYINHPTKEMHNLFADMLFDIVMADAQEGPTQSESTMYRE